MATHKSALKRHRQSLARRTRNRIVKGGVRRAIKRTRADVNAGEVESAEESLLVAISRLDRAAQKGVIHKNNAARSKARLVKLVRATGADTN